MIYKYHIFQRSLFMINQFFNFFILYSINFNLVSFRRSQKISTFKLIWSIFFQNISKIMLYHTTSNPNFLILFYIFQTSCNFVFSFLTY